MADLTKLPGRQTVLVARKTTAAADISAQGTYTAIDMPANSIVVGGYARVTAAFDSSVAIDIGDGDDDDRYVDAGSAVGYPAAAALAEQTLDSVVALAVTGHKYTAADTIDVKLSGAANTTGTLDIVVLYIIAGREAEVFGI